MQISEPAGRSRHPCSVYDLALSMPTGEAASARCVVCGPVTARSVVTTDGFQIVRCPSCELVFVDTWHNLPALDELYTAAYFQTRGESSLGYHDYLAHRTLHLRNAHALLRRLDRGIPDRTRRLLEVGCAHGFFLAAARDRGWTTHGVDISPGAVQYARETLGLDVVRGEIGDAQVAEASLDVIALIGTIEHLTDPVATLRRAAELLKPGGHLLITTLDIEGVLRQFEWKPPEHLFYFSFRTLATVLDTTGFEVTWRRWYWGWYETADLTARLLRYWRIPRPARVGVALRRIGLGALPIKIPTNEMLVLARKR